MLAVAKEQLLRRDDPLHEIHELTIYEIGYKCEFWERIKFLNNADVYWYGMVASGTQAKMQEKFGERVAELVEQGFDLCRK